MAQKNIKTTKFFMNSILKSKCKKKSKAYGNEGEFLILLRVQSS